MLLDLVSAVQNRGLTTPLTANRMLVTTISVSALTQMALIYMPLLQGIFQTQALAFTDLLLLFLLCGLSFAAHEARRRYERRMGANEELRESWEDRMV